MKPEFLLLDENKQPIPYPKQETEQLVQVAFELLDNALNRMGSEEIVLKTFFNELTNTHRTLQQLFWGLINELIIKYAGTNFDMRNEAAVKMCQDLKQTIEDKEIYLPFV